jgi:hypothetical protein
MMNRPSLLCALVAALALSLTSAALAAEPKKGPPADPSPETRQQMAAVHQKMADCLRSDRPFAECRSEMMKSCHDMMGEDGCPMMGGPGMMGHGMMGPTETAPTPKKK